MNISVFVLIHTFCVVNIQGLFIHFYPKLLLDSFGCIPSIIYSQIAPWLQSTLKWWKWIKLITDSQRESLLDIKSCVWPADVRSSGVLYDGGPDRVPIAFLCQSPSICYTYRYSPPAFSSRPKTLQLFAAWPQDRFLLIELSPEMSHGRLVSEVLNVVPVVKQMCY